MAEYLIYNHELKVLDSTLDPTDPNFSRRLAKEDQSDGFTVSWSDRNIVTIATGANKTLTFASMGFPTGAKVEWVAFVTYGDAVALALRLLTITIDAAATDSIITWMGAGQAATSLKFANASGADAKVEIMCFVRTT